MSDKTLEFPAVGPLGRLSAAMCLVVAVGGVLAELGLAWVWLSPGLIETYVLPRLGLAASHVALTAPLRFSGFLICMLPMAMLLFLLHQAYELFDSFRRGRVFAAEVPLRLRRIGLCLVALAVLRPVTGALLSVMLTAANASGQRMLVLSISVDDYMIAALGGLVLAIGHVMIEANRLADESRQIV